MIYYKNNEWHISNELVKYKEDGVVLEAEIGQEGKQWWLDFEEKWENMTIIKFTDIEVTQEQTDRLKEVNKFNIAEGRDDVIELYVIHNKFPDFMDHPLKDLELTKLRETVNLNLLATRKMLKEVELTDNELLELIDIYEDWENWVDKKIPKGERVKYNDKLYEVIKGLLVLKHQTPDTVPSEYNVIQPAGIIPEWKQPAGGHDAYKLGDKVTHKNKTWVCDKTDAGGNNTWEPGVYGWKEIVYKEAKL